MGHDIFLKSLRGREIAYIRYSIGGNGEVHTLYESLNISHLDGGVSGVGDSALLTKSKLIYAMKQAQSDYMKGFLRKGVEYLNKYKSKELIIWCG